MPIREWQQDATFDSSEKRDGWIKPQVFTLTIFQVLHLLVERLHIQMPLRDLHLDGVI